MTKTAQTERLITENLGLVHACANRFRGRGVEYEDLFQAGCVGLALGRYKKTREAGCTLVLAGLSDRDKRMMKLSGMQDMKGVEFR